MLPGVIKLMLELSTHNRTVRVTAGLEFRMHIERPENAFRGLKYEKSMTANENKVSFFKQRTQKT